LENPIKQEFIPRNKFQIKRRINMKARIPKTAGAQNMNQMVRQAQKMQDQITELQADIEAREFTATAGGGVVEATLNGKKEIKTLTLKPEVVDPEDIETLQDLIIAAINEAVSNIEATTETEMSKITGGVSIPGMFN
jgi:DNA-binding YbaB/EbfC family protein